MQLLVERRQSDEANQCMGMIRKHDGQRPMGEYGQDAGVPPLLFFEGHPGIFNDHRETRPRFNVSSERRKLRKCGHFYRMHWSSALMQYVQPAMSALYDSTKMGI